MARDVVSRVHGMDRDAVVELLGQPSDRLDAATDAGGHRLRGAEVFSYYIGSWSGYGFDDAFVYVHLDADGHVIYSEVTGY
ncbi:hypothetical protein MFFC18_47400 [Mariniblastus fucicola]|uniref:Uncharacterized protein n=2 Tax=Mariniblastus fucicola TaxID=980251 RepID=A0A5B9PDP3_9BACT|nr:hypothetical protein MFFC18_47380 [Mariniblastus fucicola]QEG24817.1 hypothetical protein MFFC18_47400 [Mariniblastus fucicola]